MDIEELRKGIVGKEILSVDENQDDNTLQLGLGPAFPTGSSPKTDAPQTTATMLVDGAVAANVTVTTP